MVTKQIIYIKILDEAIDVYAPAIGEQITKNFFLVLSISHQYKEEDLEFVVGDKVLIQSKMLTNGEEYKRCKVAISKSKSIKPCKTDNLKIHIHPKTKKILICNKDNEIIHIGGKGFRYDLQPLLLFL